jgi:hypothetical protein
MDGRYGKFLFRQSSGRYVAILTAIVIIATRHLFPSGAPISVNGFAIPDLTGFLLPVCLNDEVAALSCVINIWLAPVLYRESVLFSTSLGRVRRRLTYLARSPSSRQAVECDLRV